MKQLKLGTAVLLAVGDNARGGFWRWALSFVTLIASFFAFGVLLHLAVSILFPTGSFSVSLAEELGQERASSLTMTSLTFLVLTALIPSLALALRVLGLKISDIVTPRTRPNWYLSAITALMVFAIVGGISLFSMWTRSQPGDITFDPLSGIALLYIPILIVLIVFQASAEELVFRGYLIQLVGRWTKSWWLITLVTGSVFFSLHLQSPIFDAIGWLAYLNYILLSVLFTLLALITGRLEYSIGAHIGWNWSLLIVDYKPPSAPDLYFGAGAFLYTGPIGPHFIDAIFIFLQTLVVFLVCLLVHYRYFEPFRTSE